MKLLILHYQKLIVEELLNEIEGRSMDVPLEQSLKLGNSFPIINSPRVGML